MPSKRRATLAPGRRRRRRIPCGVLASACGTPARQPRWPPGAPRAALLLLAGCRCAEGPLTTLEPGFRVAPETRALDFGRVLEGSTVTLIVVVSETQVSVRVAARTGSPFFVPEAVEIAGGASAELPVAFLAGAALATEVVTLTANDVDVEVPVRGTGVRPLDCQPSAECRVASYFFEEHRCVEAFAAEDTPCNTGSECLERGRCREGACVGVARSCDDGDACTVDACSPTAGCVLSAVQCPRPSNPCQLPTCDWQTGCGQRSAPDLTVCGPVDCTSASVCSGGACITVPTPEGWACAPPVLCYGRGECHAQRCVRTDAGASWAPSWSTPFAGKVLHPGRRPPRAPGQPLLRRLRARPRGLRTRSRRRRRGR